MSGMELLKMVWAAMNQPAALVVIGGGVIMVMNAIFAKKPTWKVYAEKYAGTLFAAVRYAEKAIPDDVDNKSVARLDAALKYMVKVIEATEGKAPTAKEEAALAEAVQMAHKESAA